MRDRTPDFERVAQLVSLAGGRVVGRTKLQKIAYLLEATGLGGGFSFEYKHYGPYSEDLAAAARSAKLMGVLDEDEVPTAWGGFYSVYTTNRLEAEFGVRSQLVQVAAAADAIELELAATAAFLAAAGLADPWLETAKRKPEKSTQARLAAAKALYSELRNMPTPRKLPPA